MDEILGATDLGAHGHTGTDRNDLDLGDGFHFENDHSANTSHGYRAADRDARAWKAAPVVISRNPS